MPIRAIINSEYGETLNKKCRPGNAFCHLDEYTGRVVLAHPQGTWDEEVIVHAKDEYGFDASSLTFEGLKKICLPKYAIAEIMPWGQQTFDIHESDGIEALLTIKSIPIIQLFPYREAEAE